MKYSYIQGEFVEIGALPVGRGFRYGDGVFETIRVENAQPYNLEFHLNRLFRGCEALHIEIDCDVFDIIDQLLPYNKVESGFVKVIISRDAESKGYLPLSNKSRVLVETTEGIAEVKQPATYCISEFKAQRVVNAKTLSSLHYVMSLLEATRNKFDNSLLLNDAGKICEFASGNIFWLKGGTLFTPSEELPLISGSIRERVLNLYKGNLVEGEFDVSELHDADEIFMTNVNCLVQSFKKPELSQPIRKLIEDDILSTLG